MQAEGSEGLTDIMTRASAQLTIVHTEASLGWGGQEIRILAEAQGMIGRGHRVTLLCPPEARIYSEAPRWNVPVVALPIGRKRINGVIAMYRWLKANPVDVINTHSSADTWLTAFASLFLKNPPPLVRSRHISAPVSRGFSSRWLYEKASTHIVTTGERLRQQLIMDNGFKNVDITSVPTGIDTARFVPGDRAAARARLGLNAKALLIGIVATLRSWKGHDYLLQALARMSHPNAQLVIVGDGPQRDVLRERIAALGLAARVTMPGNQNDVVPWLQAMDVFALPSYANEGVPQAIMQAMLCGLPVVTTPVGSIGEIVSDGSTGIMVTPRDVDSLARALDQLAADAGLRERIGASARSFALERFGLDKMLFGMETVFMSAIAKSARGAESAARSGT